MTVVLLLCDSEGGGASEYFAEECFDLLHNTRLSARFQSFSPIAAANLAFDAAAAAAEAAVLWVLLCCCTNGGPYNGCWLLQVALQKYCCICFWDAAQCFSPAGLLLLPGIFVVFLLLLSLVVAAAVASDCCRCCCCCRCRCLDVLGPKQRDGHKYVMASNSFYLDARLWKIAATATATT